MQIKRIDKEICLLDGIKITIDIDIPLSDDADLREGDTFIDDILIKQVLRGLRNSIDKYKESELPNKFLKAQHYIITNNLPMNSYGMFRLIGDDIYVDADAISGITPVGSVFLHAHEVGHKIAKYINTYQAYKDIADVLNISVEGNEHTLAELFADECGNIVAASTKERENFRFSLGNKREYIQRKILYNIYRG